MIRWGMSNIIERFAGDRDYMRLAKFELFGRFQSEREALRCPSKHRLPNLTPLWANGNLSADSSHSSTVGIFKRNVNVTVCFHFCVNDAPCQSVPFLLRRHSL